MGQILEIEFLDLDFLANSNLGTIANPYVFREPILIEGCTEETAFNYDPGADQDDGSCIDTVEGCLDENALNYNSNANVDDGSCELVIYGCMDDTMYNFDSTANVNQVF